MNSPQIQCIARFPISMLSQLENFELGRQKNYFPMAMDSSPMKPQQPQPQNKKFIHQTDLLFQQYQNLISPQEQNGFDLNMIFNSNKQNENQEPSLISTNDSDKQIEIDKLLNLDFNETLIDPSEYMIELNNQPINWQNQESVSLGNSKIREGELQQLKQQKEQDLFQPQQQEFYEEEPFDELELENNEIKCDEEVLPLFDQLTDSVIKKIENYKEFDQKEMLPLKINESEFLNDKFNGKIDYAFYKPQENPNLNNLPANLNIMKTVRQSQQNQTQNIALLLGYYEKINEIQQQKKEQMPEHILSNNSYKIKKRA